jgi:uncharacterized protein with ParB-like and HNH nuclease domain
MDTIVKGLPIPIIFIRERTDINTLEPKRQIVDGQQRIRAILTYIDHRCLKDYKESRDFFQVKRTHNIELSGKNFKDLSPELKQTILDYQFSVHLLPSDVDDKQVLQIFARMNATGVKLNAQEIRNAEFSGVFKQTMYNLAYEQLKRWRDWNIFTENNIARMDEVEMTSDFALLMYKGISAKTKTGLNNLYKSYEETFPEKKYVKKRFQDVMDTTDDKLGKKLPELEFRKKTLFYVLFALVYDLHYGLGTPLTKKRKKPIPTNFINKINGLNDLFEKKKLPEDVAKSARGQTTNLKSRRILYKYIKDFIGRA